MLVKATFAALLSIMSASAMAAQCEATIESNDAMQFNTKEMTVEKTCKEFTVHLKHACQLPKAALGDNWVLTKEADQQGVATDRMAAGLDKHYVKADDTRDIAHPAGSKSTRPNSRSQCASPNPS